jgi:hypothetical protein
MKNPFGKKNVEVTYTEVATYSTLGSDGKVAKPGDRTNKSFVTGSVKDAQKELNRRSRGGEREVVNPTAKKTRKPRS